MGLIYGSRHSYNLDRLGDLGMEGFQNNFIDDNGNGTLSVRTNDKGERILTYSSSNIAQRTLRIAKWALGGEAYHLDGVQQKDIRKLIYSAESNRKISKAFLKILKNDILPQAEDTDQWSEPIKCDQSLTTMYEDLTTLSIDLAASYQEGHAVVAKKENQGVRFLVLPADELTEGMALESKNTLTDFFKETLHPYTWDRYEIVGSSRWLTEMFYDESNNLKDRPSLDTLHRCISQNLKVMLELTSEEDPHRNEMLGISKMPSSDALIKNREILKELAHLSPGNTRGSVYPFTCALLRFQEEQILSRVGYQKTEMSRSELVARLNELDPTDPEINLFVLKKLVAQASLFEAMGKNEKTKDYPFKELFRLFIDGYREDEGDYVFETEPGYLTACFNGLTYALNCESGEKDIDWHEQIHDRSVENVLVQPKQSLDKKYYAQEKGISLDENEESGKMFPLGPLESDPHGIEDLLKRGAKDFKDASKPFAFIRGMVGTSIAVQHLKPLPELKAELNHLFSTMYANTKDEKNPVTRLMQYAWLARELELRHIYADANGRTSITVIYALVAEDPDLPMLCFHDPNVLDANGPEKICYRLLEGMQKFENGGRLDSPRESKKGKLDVSDFDAGESLKQMKAYAVEHFSSEEKKHWAYYFSKPIVK